MHSILIEDEKEGVGPEEPEEPYVEAKPESWDSWRDDPVAMIKFTKNPVPRWDLGN